MFKAMAFIAIINFSFPIFAHVSSYKDPLDIDKFDIPESPANELGNKLILWGTYYLTPRIKDTNGGYPLRNLKGEILGPSLTKKEWCNVALEGSAQIATDNQEARTYNYSGETSDFAINCKEFFKFDVSRTKFALAHGPYGDGLSNKYILAPFRTIATDNTYVVPGTVIFIPKARGAKIKLPNGKSIVHDGYFFAGDKGGAIKRNHIDVFIGTDNDAPYFPWIKSTSSGTFEAFIVKDPKIISELTELHAQ